MFTGIVEEAGTVERIKPTAKSVELTVRVNATGRGLKTGDSLAVNGCCLTAVKVSARGNGAGAGPEMIKSGKSKVRCPKSEASPVCATLDFGLWT